MRRVNVTADAIMIITAMKRKNGEGNVRLFDMRIVRLKTRCDLAVCIESSWVDVNGDVAQLELLDSVFNGELRFVR